MWGSIRGENDLYREVCACVNKFVVVHVNHESVVA